MKKNTNKQKDEIDQLLQDLENEASLPDPKFEASLKSKVLSKVKERNNTSLNLLQIFNFHNLGLVLGVFVLFGFFIGIGVIGGWYLYSNGEGNLKTTEVAFNDEQKEEFLTSVIKSNAENVLNKELTQKTQLSNTAAEITVNVKEPVVLSYDRKYSYSHTTSKTIPGKSADFCLNYYPKEAETIENYFFHDKENGFTYYKSISKDENGELKNYNLWTDDGNYFYLGGDYAVRKINQQVDEEPGKEIGTVSSENKDLIKSYFGEDAKIEKDTHGNYIIIWDAEYNCKSSDDALTELDRGVTSDDTELIDGDFSKLVYRSFVNIDTFEITKEEVYVGSISEENRLTTYETRTEKDNSTLDDVKHVFTFEYSVEVKDINEEKITKTEYVKELSNFLVQDGTKVIYPKDPGYDLRFATAQTDSIGLDEYLLDRDFYPTSEEGDKMYAEALKLQEKYNVYKYSKIFFEYNNSFVQKDDSYMTIRIGVGYYEKDSSSTLNLNEDNIVSEEDTTISIDGQKINAKLHEVHVSSDNENTKTFLYSFEFDNYKVKITIITHGELDKEDVTGMEYSVYDSSKSKDLKELTLKIEESLKSHLFGNLED